jgi:hypothetical protein
MKITSLVTSLLAATAFSVSVAFASDAAKPAPAPAGKKGGCCVKAEKAGKACDHPCCVESAKAGKNCEKCGGTNEKKT